MMSEQWEDETAGERIGHPTSYMRRIGKLLTFHTQSYLRSSL